MTPTPVDDCVVVSSVHSERLLRLLLRLGFTARRLDSRQLLVEHSTVDEVHRFALLFHIRTLRISPCELVVS